jgi:hypothetical protein
MRILSLVFASAALMSATAPVAAQSPYSYPWCSRQSSRDNATTSCYFTSYQQCMTTLSGIGGYWYQSPYYEPSSQARSKGRQSPRRADRIERQ